MENKKDKNKKVESIGAEVDVDLFNKLIEKRDLKGIKKMIEYVDFSKTDACGLTPLNQAILCIENRLIELFIKYGADINGKDGHGRAPIHISVLLWNNEALEILLKKGADVNLTLDNRKGETALHLAVKEGNIKAIKMLIKAGADINIKDKSNRTPVDIAKEKLRYSKNKDMKEIIDILKLS